MANTYTFSDAQNAVYEQLRANPSTKESNRVYPIDLVKKSINDAHQMVLNKKNYSFLNKTINFATSIDTALAEDIISTDVTFDVEDADGLNTSGNIVVSENVIAYTGVTTNTLTGVTGINTDYDSGATVKQLYSLSSDLGITDFKKPTSLFINGKEIEYYDYRGKQDELGFTIYGSNLYIPKQSTSEVGIFKYVQEITLLTDDTDVFLIPDDYITLVVEYSLFKCHKQVDNDMSILAFNEFKRIVGEFEADYSKQTNSKFTKIHSIYEPNYYNA